MLCTDILQLSVLIKQNIWSSEISKWHWFT